MSKRPAWQRWDRERLDPDRDVRAPAGQLRVCAYHIDWDEQPVCFVDVGTRAEAERIADDLNKLCEYNVDYVATFDEAGELVHSNRPW